MRQLARTSASALSLCKAVLNEQALKMQLQDEHNARHELGNLKNKLTNEKALRLQERESMYEMQEQLREMKAQLLEVCAEMLMSKVMHVCICQRSQ